MDVMPEFTEVALRYGCTEDSIVSFWQGHRRPPQGLSEEEFTAILIAEVEEVRARNAEQQREPEAARVPAASVGLVTTYEVNFEATVKVPHRIGGLAGRRRGGTLTAVLNNFRHRYDMPNASLSQMVADHPETRDLLLSLPGAGEELEASEQALHSHNFRMG